MATQLIIYTRLENFDYRLIFAPSRQMLPEPYRSEFIDFVREVINSDNFGSIKSPRYAVIKRNDLCLIGIGCDNSCLGEVKSNIERREIRGFFGVVSNEPFKPSVIQTLSQLDFYKDLFTSFIIPKWHTSKRNEDDINSIVEHLTINKEEQPTSIFDDIDINIDVNLCKIHSHQIEPSSLISSCVKHKNVDAVTNLNSEAHVTSAPLYKFHNVTINESVFSKTISYKKTETKEFLEKGKKGHSDPAVASTKRTKALRDEGCLSRCVDKVEHFLSKYGINPKSFLEIFAKRHNLRVISEKQDEESVLNSAPVQRSRLESIDISENVISSELDDFHNKRTHRRSIIEDLQTRYKESEMATQSSTSSLTDEKQEQQNQGQSIEIESIDL